jgi:hypothetical protein
MGLRERREASRGALPMLTGSEWLLFSSLEAGLKESDARREFELKCGLGVGVGLGVSSALSME